MSINKLETGKYQADIRINGIRKRKSFRTKGEATRWIHHTNTLAIQGKEWNPKIKDSRNILELAKLWQELHGKNLNDKSRKKRLYDLCLSLGNPKINDLKKEHFIKYRASRLNEGITACTLNKEQVFISSMLNFLVSVDMVEKNPLKNIKKLKEVQQDLIFLDDNQIKLLLSTVKEMNQKTYISCLVGFATGARWSEIKGLTIENIKNNAIYYSNTKSKKSRRVPINKNLETILLTYLSEYNSLYESFTTFRKAINKSGIKLPQGQLTHVMRHSFASHYIKNGGDILELKELLGHSTIDMTMRYAHLAPDKTLKVLKLNPLANIKDL